MEAESFYRGEIPLVSKGRLLLQIEDEMIARQLKARLVVVGVEIVLDGIWLQIKYSSWVQLQRCIGLVQMILTDKQMEVYEGSLLGEVKSDDYRKVTLPLSQLSLIIENPSFVKIIQEKLFQSYMQPIISSKERIITGYEFLLRPNSKVYPFVPTDLFMFAQHAGLQNMLDSQSRINAIRTGAQMLSEGMKYFINFLPSSINDPIQCLKSTFKAVEDYRVNPSDLVFEVVETEKIFDINHLRNIFQFYRQEGVKVALDDVGAGYSTYEILKQLVPDYVKIDPTLIHKCHLSERKMSDIKYLRNISQQLGIILLAEGVESAEEFAAVEPFVDLVQGFYFGKPIRNPA
ncbi:EAL domain-containing protein [Salipaludibacillus agaradhaerens]|uniref:EAL domain-containing protein n=1 Tax=Salipaludibacillus agaradhaerens TaxID=76935 RepID=A0A9Q4FVM4_SALAG|nr:EAL domain-containing protein [Salipaludibacillus agaradhaerens]MCR6095715.1 EAL domain-containing protein [Salipaludibacillus agaradhaerens]MCR6114725.1 EAL domain-containing protein [Salipaludibacillus agaradhaerens]